MQSIRSLFPGYRASALILMAVLWFSVGLGLIDRPFIPGAGHPLPLEYLPLWVRVAIWWVAAACGIVAAFWPPGNDRWGWVVMSVPASMRFVSYAVGALMDWIDTSYVVAWTIILLLLVLFASWPEPPSLSGDDR